MTEELSILRDITTRLEGSGIDYMLTGSVALACHAQPRMTRDIDLVAVIPMPVAVRIGEVLGPDYHVSPKAAIEAVQHQSSFNAIHEETLIKVDILIRKQDEYRLREFARRQRFTVAGFELWVVSKEDLILSKLDWARESLSIRQLSDVESLLASGCDLEYVREWSVALNLTDMLTRVLP